MMKQVISASRRTDMPGCYFGLLRKYIEQGFADVSNPYSGKVYRVDLAPESVHTLVLWSKDFSRVCSEPALFEPYNLYFLFTLNDYGPLEPQVPSVDDRIAQLRTLALRYGAERVAWRFDPVIFGPKGPVTPFQRFQDIARCVAETGVRRMIFSFLDMYGKVQDRIRRYNLNIVDPPQDLKQSYAEELCSFASSIGLTPEICCESIHVPGIPNSSCINGALLSELAGEQATMARDTGQRSSCNCTKSRDIGSYKEMPCPHGCLYCYANPVIQEYCGC